MKLEIVQTQSWRYKTNVVIKRQQQTTISKKNKKTNELPAIARTTVFPR